jgi:predicted  nucleic acid-binding Zn-ribbon protein
MEKLTAKKKLSVLMSYFCGLSYDEIAAKSGVSKGTVANIIADLKAGSFPEAADVGEHIEVLRDLSFDLRRSNLSPGRCATGLILLNRINECGLDPADIDRWPMILKSVRNDDDAKEFVRLVYSIKEAQQRSGLNLEALDDKVHEVDRKAGELESISNKVKDCRKELSGLTRQRDEFVNTVALLEQKNELLSPRVKDLQERDKTLSSRIADMEPKAQKAEMTLSSLRGEMQKLKDTGFSLKELAEFNEKLHVIAQHHIIKPAELRGRLLHDLEALDTGLGVETLIQNRQQEIDNMEQAIAGTKGEIQTTRAIVENLKREQTALEGSIKETREKVSREIMKIIPLAHDTISKLGEELRRGNDEALTEMRRLMNETIEVGKDVGRYEGILKSCEWLNELLALMRGEEDIAGERVRTIALLVVRALHIWLKRHDSVPLTLLPLTVETLIRELEQWKT